MEDVKFYIGGSGPVVPNSTETEAENAEDIFESDPETSDVPLSDLQMLEKTIQSDHCYIRQASVHYVLHVLRLADAAVDDVQPAFNAIVRLSNDEEGIVRLELMRQIFDVAQCCGAKAEFQTSVYVYVLPVVVKLLCDYNGEVRKASREALVQIMKSNTVSEDYIESGIVPAAVQILDQDAPDELRAEGVVLMADVASCCCQTTNENLFIPRFLHLCTDMLFLVRKACALKFGEFCSSVRWDVMELLLLPKFASLTEDGVWGVRKACAESFVKVSLACSMETRKTVLVRIFLGLINDQSRWVRMAVYQSIGGFIASFADPSQTGLQLTEGQTVIFTNVTPNDICPQPKEECETISLTCKVQSGEAAECRPCATVHDQGMVEHHLQPEDLAYLPTAEYTTSPNCESESSNVPDSIKCSVTEPGHSDNSPSDISRPAVRKLDIDGKREMPSDGSGRMEFTAPSNETDVHDNTIQSTLRHSIDSHPAADSVRTGSSPVESEHKSSTGYSENASVESAKSDQIDSDRVVVETVSTSSASAHDDGLLNRNPEATLEGSPVSSDSLQAGTVEIESMGKATSRREIFTASLNEMSLPLDETVAHIGSTHVHMTDELSIVDGVVTPVESGVKIDVTRRPVTLSLKDDMAVESSVSLSSSDDLSPQHDSTADPADLGNLSPLHMIRKNMVELPQRGLLAYHAAEIPDEMLTDEKPSVAVSDHPVSQQIVPQVLLDYYMSMTESSRVHTVDCDITYHCAYSFPAIVFTLGRCNWPHVSKLFSTLSSSLQWKVRRTVASSLHCIAATVGEEITEKELLPVFNELLNDVDEVRTALVEHFADFIFLLPASLRRSFLPRVAELLNVDNARNWRYRVDVTLHLFRLFEAYTVDEFCQHILPVILGDLVHDNVAEVRHTAVKVLSGVLGKLSSSEDTERVNALAGDLIERFSRSNIWSQRQMYVSLCSAVLSHLLQTNEPLPQAAVDLVHQLVPPLLQLSADPVPNVRITLARCLAQCCANFAVCVPRELQEAIKAAVITLQNDADHDVCNAALSRRSAEPVQGRPVIDS